MRVSILDVFEIEPEREAFVDTLDLKAASAEYCKGRLMAYFYADGLY